MKTTRSLPSDNRLFWRTMLGLALPIAFQNLLSSSFSLLDTVMVSQLGGNELSAVGMSSQWSWVFITLLFGFSSGAAVLQSQYWGVRDDDGIKRVITVALSGALICLLPFFLIPLISPTFVISLFNEDAAVVEAGSRYLKIVLWSYPGLALNSVLASALRSTEHVKLPMISSLVSMLLNVGCNYCLIFGIGPIPSFGVAGAAIATVVSAWFGPLFLVSVSVAQKNILYGAIRSYFRFPRGEIKRILQRILPVVGNELVYGLASLALSLIFSNLGKDEYGGMTIFTSFSNLALSFCQGICSACCIMVGKKVGSGEIRGAVRDVKLFSVCMTVFSFFLGMLIIALRAPIIRIFNLSGGLSEVTVATAGGILLFYGFEIALRNFPNLQVLGVLRAGGNVVAGSFFDLLCLWGLSIPSAFLASRLGAPFLAVFAVAYLCEDVPKSILCLIFFFKGKWIKPVTKEGKEGFLLYQKEKAEALCQGGNKK